MELVLECLLSSPILHLKKKKKNKNPRYSEAAISELRYSKGRLHLKLPTRIKRYMTVPEEMTDLYLLDPYFY